MFPLRLFPLLLLFCLRAINATDYNVEFTIGNHIINNLPELYYGFMTDWLTKEPWTNGSILEADFSNADLISLTRALGPAIWRIGGTPQDAALYNFTGMCLTPPEHSYCSKSAPINCLNITRWNQINTFAMQTNSKILFGLNACFGREHYNSAMNFTNIEQLFEYSSTQQNGFDNLYGFEFGNEQNGHIDPETYSKDFISAYNLLNKYKWNKQTPIFIGFDPEQSSEAQEWTTQIYSNLSKMTNGNLSSIMTSFTYHNYPCCHYPNGDISVYPIDCLKKIANEASSYYSISTQKYNIQTWMGEGSDCSGGGIANQTNRWIGSFYYMYQLSEVARHKLKATVRADLVGGNYELIDRYTYIPNPDYWILWLHKNYIGKIMYNASFNTSQETTYIHGWVYSSKQHNNQYYICSLINFNLNEDASVTINIQNDDMDGYLFDSYHIEGVGNDGLNTNVISVNNMIMEYSNGSFPKLIPKTSSNPTIVLQAHTIALVIVYKQ